MLNVIPRFNGKVVSASGQVVTPPGTELSLLVQGIEFIFQFSKTGSPLSVDIVPEGTRLLIKAKDFPSLATAFNIERFNIAGLTHSMAVAVETIGGDEPHRVISYSIYEDA